MSRKLSDEGEHRRGLVLGLTLAEMLTLLLFVLLIALAVRLKEMSTQIERTQQQLTQVKNEKSSLEASLSTLSPLADELKKNGIIESDGINELANKISKLDQLEKQVSHLQGENQQLHTDLSLFNALGADSQQKIRSMGPMFSDASKIDPSDPPAVLRKGIEAVKEFGTSVAASDLTSLANTMKIWNPDISQGIKSLKDVTGRASRADNKGVPDVLQDALTISDRIGTNDPDRVGTIADLQKNVEQTKSELRTAQGERDRFRLERENLIHGGRGLMFPSCWIGQQGETEYIFDVTLSDEGVEVVDTYPPHRGSDEALKLVGPFARESVIQEKVFRNATAKLFAWSKEHDCRFVVKMRDATGTESKQRYKQLRTLVEGHFYIANVESPKPKHIVDTVVSGSDDADSGIPVVPRRPRPLSKLPSTTESR